MTEPAVADWQQVQDFMSKAQETCGHRYHPRSLLVCTRPRHAGNGHVFEALYGSHVPDKHTVSEASQ